MSYRRTSLAGLGEVNSPEARAFVVEPGWGKAWLDAALTVQGIPTAQAERVPGAVERTLRESGAEVDRVEWGGGAGLEDIRGKVYARWRPGRPENAVAYADIARHVFAAAAEGFPAGSRIIMSRYRIDRAWPFSDIYVYPEGGPLPASAPEVARRSSAADLPPVSSDPPLPAEAEARLAREVLPIVGVVGGVTVLVVGGAVAYLVLRHRRKYAEAERRWGKPTAERLAAYDREMARRRRMKRNRRRRTA